MGDAPVVSYEMEESRLLTGDASVVRFVDSRRMAEAFSFAKLKRKMALSQTHRLPFHQRTLCSDESEERRKSGNEEPRNSGTVETWNCGIVELRNRGNEEPWNSGNVELRNRGIAEAEK